MRTIPGLICIIVFVSAVTGCQQPGSGQAGELLVVGFKPDTTLKYKWVSQRDVIIDLGSGGSKKSSKKSSQHKTSEKLELIIAYTPIKIDPYGLTSIRAKCEFAKVTRSQASPRGSRSVTDAVETLAGQTYTFEISPTGKIADYTNFKEVIHRLGKKAFLPSKNNRGRIKNPDMISDFVAMQWYLWDSIATNPKPLEGIRGGRSWTAKQLVPLPIPIPVARDTTYSLDEILETPDGRKAIINCSYALNPTSLEDWPKPYGGTFSVKGSLFALMRNFRPQTLEGTGKQVFNIDTGTVESEQQKYKMTMKASFLMPLGDSDPVITVDQKISLKLLNN